MKRRDMLRLTAALPLLQITPALARKDDAGDWRVWAMRYEVDVSDVMEAGRVWLPLPRDTGDYQRVAGINWSGNAEQTRIERDPVYQSPMLTANWGPRVPLRNLSVLVKIATRDRDMKSAPKLAETDAALARAFLQPTPSMPTDGIVAETATKIVQGIDQPFERARAIYDWVVDNTFRDPKVQGCGTGNIKFMLESGNLGGKCADINSLFVGLARAAGIPAREAYGVRLGPSRLFACLGKDGGDVSKAQHCRAEFFVREKGWIGVDPADVRKAVLEENLPLEDKRVKQLREYLFGNWEMNWTTFNYARDFALEPPAAKPLPYLMYPYAEFGSETRDGRDPATFKYTITSRQIPTA